MPKSKPTPLTQPEVRALMLKKLRDSGLVEADARLLKFLPLTASERRRRCPDLTKFDLSGVVIPYYGIDGKDTGFFRYRFLEQPEPTSWSALGKQKPLRYTQEAGAAPRAYFPRNFDWVAWLKSPEKRLYITEGELKAACACKFGIPCIGLGGTENFKSATEAFIKDLADLPWGEIFPYICYDSDAETNRQVQTAESKLYVQIAERCPNPALVVRLPAIDGNKTGLDDLLIHPEGGLELFNQCAYDAQPGSPFIERDQYIERPMAETFALESSEELRYLTDTQQWVTWKGGIWHRELSLVKHRLGEFIKAKMPKHLSDAELEQKFPGDPKAQQAFKGSVSATRAKINTARYEAAVLSLASGQLNLLAKQEDFDADLYLLGVPSGVVDLRSGKVRPARPEDFISRSTTVAPSEGNVCPKWVKFVAEINDGDKDMVAYFARLCGCFLTGSVSDEVLTWWYGKGGNGKGTAIETLKHILGAVETSGYATDLPVEAVMFKKAVNDYSIQNDIAKLQGARLAVVDEGEKHSRLNSSLLNRLTGGGRITGKLMRENKHEFPMTHKLVILSNHRPRVECDDAMKRRLNLIPFLQKWVKHTPSPEEKSAGVRQADLSLKADLLKESPGILRWAINGCLSYLKDGLKPPQTVTDFTTEFFEKADQYEEWAESRRHKWEKEAFATTDTLFADWVDYCKVNQQWAGDKQAFSEDLGKHDKFKNGRSLAKDGRRRGFHGLMMNTRTVGFVGEPNYSPLPKIKGQK